MNNSIEEQLLARIAYLEQAINTYGLQIRGLNDAVESLQIVANTPSQVQLPQSTVELTELMGMRSLFSLKERKNEGKELPSLLKHHSFDDYLKMVKDMDYGAFDEWYKLLEPNLVSYQEDPEAGISVEENEGAQLFRQFVAPYAAGTVLDIGCGISKMPIYLADFDPNLVAGSDPLCPELERDFQFFHGLAEIIPYPDNSFDNIVVATSMDHFLDPMRALNEAHRVLKPTGRLLLWMGFIPNSSEYDPMDSTIKPVDEYHLFHFSQAWFEPWLESVFKIKENITVNSVSSFYACAPLKK